MSTTASIPSSSNMPVEFQRSGEEKKRTKKLELLTIKTVHLCGQGAARCHLLARNFFCRFFLAAVGVRERMGNVVGHYNSGGHSHSECGLEVIRAAAESVGVSSSSEYPMGALSGPLRREKHKDKHHKGGARVVELRGSTHGVPELQQLGGKAKKLIELDGVVTVPPGCVVTSSVYAEVVVARLGLRFDLDDDDLLREGHKRILGEARVPVDVCVAVDRVTAQYPGTRWAVRSSATLEDGSEFSMAGLAESFLFVDAANVSEAVVKCWASLWTTRVGKYFQNADISQTPLMAVVVQQMIVIGFFLVPEMCNYLIFSFCQSF